MSVFWCMSVLTSRGKRLHRMNSPFQVEGRAPCRWTPPTCTEAPPCAESFPWRPERRPPSGRRTPPTRWEYRWWIKEAEKKNSLSSLSETFRLSVQRRLELKENKKKWFLHLSSCKKGLKAGKIKYGGDGRRVWRAVSHCGLSSSER